MTAPLDLATDRLNEALREAQDALAELGLVVDSLRAFILSVRSAPPRTRPSR